MNAVRGEHHLQPPCNSKKPAVEKPWTIESEEKFNLYHADYWLINPATQDHGRGGCSYVELVSTSAHEQRPQWFVSHAWLEPIVRFVLCLKRHALLRQLAPQHAYWVCDLAFSFFHCTEPHGMSGFAMNVPFWIF